MISPDKHILRDKRLLMLERELNRLHQAQWKTPAIPLERPYQKGWYKTYRIRQDALRHPDQALFLRVLPVVNQVVVSMRRDFKDRRGNAIELGTKVLRHRDWYRLSWPQSLQRLFSYGRWVENSNRPFPWIAESNFAWGFKLTRDWWLEEWAYPRMITHQRADLPEVKDRIAEIEAELASRCGRYRLHWLHGHRNAWRECRGTYAENQADAHCASHFEDIEES